MSFEFTGGVNTKFTSRKFCVYIHVVNKQFTICQMVICIWVYLKYVNITFIMIKLKQLSCVHEFLI